MNSFEVFRSNVIKLIEHKDYTVAGAAREWKIPPKTLEVLVKGLQCPTLNTADKIAEASGYQLWQMLTPAFVPGQAPVIRDITSSESVFYKKLADLVKEIPIR